MRQGIPQIGIHHKNYDKRKISSQNLTKLETINRPSTDTISKHWCSSLATASSVRIRRRRFVFEISEQTGWCLPLFVEDGVTSLLETVTTASIFLYRPSFRTTSRTLSSTTTTNVKAFKPESVVYCSEISKIYWIRSWLNHIFLCASNQRRLQQRQLI